LGESDQNTFNFSNTALKIQAYLTILVLSAFLELSETVLKYFYPEIHESMHA
jgi:hypothetical protein